MPWPLEYGVTSCVQKRDGAQWGIWRIFRSYSVKLPGYIENLGHALGVHRQKQEHSQVSCRGTGRTQEEDAGDLLEWAGLAKRERPPAGARLPPRHTSPCPLGPLPPSNSYSFTDYKYGLAHLTSYWKFASFLWFITIMLLSEIKIPPVTGHIRNLLTLHAGGNQFNSFLCSFLETHTHTDMEGER